MFHISFFKKKFAVTLCLLSSFLPFKDAYAFRDHSKLTYYIFKNDPSLRQQVRAESLEGF